MAEPGRSLEMFFIDGRPDGMLTAEVFNWTGHVLRTPRTQIAKALARQESGYTGVYILIGDRDGEPLAYIGEAEDMRHRIKKHVAEKDWWNEAILITTSANNLHKAHVKYLESRLVELARQVGNTALDNGNQPTRSSLSEAATTNMEAFLDTLGMVLPAIRVDLFLTKARPKTADTAIGVMVDDPLFSCVLPKHGIHATAQLVNGEMIVKAGSQARKTWVGSAGQNPGYSALHEKLLSQGVLSLQGDHAVFTRDYAFNSPSAAAAVVTGRSTNGRTFWVLPDGRTFAEWEAATVEETAP
ncbi:GIY-YIG nuclease family protein [Loktanella sp. SALINAS62]|uniref:GIY-YIG nuclease family protein n=1 Tax=Loktanella sp. SALINAS62 TaxID=2706124 RepID=UPI001B8B986D|nr:GIY-YIG nuclease family protein [Loktanella sp. SALINAS62]MBS1301663.1 GIY-YIG nuclease family protein [Loktanella sp. SALINAS62]